MVAPAAAQDLLAGETGHEKGTPDLAGACPCSSMADGVEAVEMDPASEHQHQSICQHQRRASSPFSLGHRQASPIAIKSGQMRGVKPLLPGTREAEIMSACRMQGGLEGLLGGLLVWASAVQLGGRGWNKRLAM